MNFPAALSFSPLAPRSWRGVPGFVLAVLVTDVSAAVVARRIVSDNGDPLLYPSYLTGYDGQLFFRANNLPSGNNVELWAFDGTVARMVADINPGPTGSDPAHLVVYNGQLNFSARDASGPPRLWQYDPVQGAVLASGSAAQASLPEEMFACGGHLYFRATRFSDVGTELWQYDGASQTPINLYPGTGSSYPQHFIEFNGQMYFNANGTPGQGSELWRYNGAGLPVEAARIYPNNGSSPEQFAVYDGQLYFSAYDGVHGRELWRYDGAHAMLAADIVPGGQYSSSNPNGLIGYNSKLYFSATDELHGYELWSFDGTTAQMVAEINPTPDPGNGDTFLMDSSPGGFVVFDGRLYFSADDGTHGRELWAFDGSTARLVLDINPGQYGSYVTELTVYDGALYFSADDGYVPGLSTLEPAVFGLAMAPLTFDEALDTTELGWSTGSHPWFAQTSVTSDGEDAVQSAPAHNADDQPWLKATNVLGPGSVSFRWKAQMDCGAFASFRVSGGTGVWPQAMDLHASTDWRWETCFFGSGPQELIWVAYGNCNDSNQITLWLDQVVLTGPGNETAPFFTTQPANLIVPAGTNVTLKAVAAGYPIPALQWRFQDQELPGATNFTLTLTNVQAAAAGDYAVVARNALGEVTNAMTLTVRESVPVILVPPADQAVTFGLTAGFAVTAQGSWPLHYQWQFNSVPLAGETNGALVLDSVTVNQAGIYSVAIANALGTTVSAGARLSVVQVAAWGENAYGQSTVPSNACDIVAVAAGSGHSLALKRDGTVIAWGDTNWNAPVSIPASVTNVARIAAGGWHSLAVRSNGTVVAWGYNGDQQTNVPGGLNDLIGVAGGLRHSVVLKADGHVRVWGYEPAAQPTAAAALAGVVAIAAGSLHNLALRSNGTVFAWGDNSLRQCNVPVGLTNVVAIAAGAGHSLALTTNGAVIAWGTNDFGQLDVPEDATNVMAIAAGDQHSLALCADGRLLAWGDNRYFQTTAPDGLTGVIALAGGRAHSVALLGAAPPAAAPSLWPEFVPAGERFSVALETVRGWTYFLESKNSLPDLAWTLRAVLFGDGTWKAFGDDAAGTSHRYYRVRVEE